MNNLFGKYYEQRIILISHNIRRAPASEATRCTRCVRSGVARQLARSLKGNDECHSGAHTFFHGAHSQRCRCGSVERNRLGFLKSHLNLFMTSCCSFCIIVASLAFTLLSAARRNTFTPLCSLRAAHCV